MLRVFKKTRKFSSFQQNSKLWDSWLKNLVLPPSFLRTSCSKLCHFHQNEMETHIFCESWYGNLKKSTYFLEGKFSMNEWMTNIIGKFFSLISNILDAKHEKIIWDNQKFCFISKFLPIFKLERFICKQKKS